MQTVCGALAAVIVMNKEGFKASKALNSWSKTVLSVLLPQSLSDMSLKTVLRGIYVVSTMCV